MGKIMMKKKYQLLIISITLLLITGMTLSPVMGSTSENMVKTTTIQNIQAQKIEKIVTIELYDCTGTFPTKVEKQLPESEYNALKEELAQIDTTDMTAFELLTTQSDILQKYNLIEGKNLNEKVITQRFGIYRNHPLVRNPITPLNNTIINAMCAINFQLDNGTTGVFGLNTFINLIGLNIISFHKGYTSEGITAIGLVQQTTEPGEYIGSMFGFLGYWFGTKTGAGFYSDLTAAGFTVMTAWLPLPE